MKFGIKQHKQNVSDPANNPYVKAVLAVALMCAAQMALAGTGGDSFDSIWVTLTDWMQGTLGRVVAGSMVLVGIVSGIVRQSIMSFATGVGGGVGLYNTPTIIESIMTATLQISG